MVGKLTAIYEKARLRTAYALLAALSVFAILFAGHSAAMMSNAHQGHEMQHDTAKSAFCAALCGAVNDSQKTKLKAPDEQSPLPPTPFTYVEPVAYERFFAASTTIALIAALFAYLRLRPPDLVIQYCRLRN